MVCEVFLTCGAARRHWHRITSSPTHPLKLFFINSFTCIRPTWQRLDAKLTHSPHIPTQPLKSFTILFLIFNFYSQLKQVFCSKYPSNKRFGANLKKLLLNFAANFLLFSFLSLKTLKINILTCDWRAQHPNAGRNIQQEMLTGAPVKGCLLSNSRLSEVEACMVLNSYDFNISVVLHGNVGCTYKVISYGARAGIQTRVRRVRSDRSAIGAIIVWHKSRKYT